MRLPSQIAFVVFILAMQIMAAHSALVFAKLGQQSAFTNYTDVE